MILNVPVKVAVIITGFGVGGVELRQLTVAKSINRKKVSIDFYCLYDEDNSLISEFEQIGYKVNVVKVFDYTKHFIFRINLFSILKLARMLRLGEYDVVHTQLPHANTVGRIAAVLAGIKKHIPTICNMEQKSRWQVFWDKLLGKRSITIMCISAAARDHDLQYTKFNKSKYTIIYNGIDVVRFSREKSRCSVDISTVCCVTNPFILCSVARLHPQKDFPTLLHAFRIVSALFEQAFLLIVGEGDELIALKKITMQLGLKDKVVFIGRRIDIPDVLACADLFVSASLSEGFGNTIIEALSMELPVIATDIFPYREIIKNGTNGILVPVRNPEKMGKAICELISNPNRRRQLGVMGRSTVVSKFSHEKMISNLEMLYISCANDWKV